MGKINLSILSDLSGKVGPVVANWHGINTLRARPRPSKKDPTQFQAEQRTKFQLVVGFAKQFAGPAAMTFSDGVPKQTGFKK